MRTLVIGLFVVCLVANHTDGADRKSELFASWQKAQRGVKSLIVEFTMESNDLVFKKRERGEGTFRLIRTAKGELFASYDVRCKNAKPEEVCISGLLSNEKVYLLNHGKKVAIRFKSNHADLLCFLELYLNPFVGLLDPKNAKDRWRLEVVKQDDWFTYLSVKPKGPPRLLMDKPYPFHHGRVILMNKASKMVSRDMPRELWHTDGVHEVTYKIKRWQTNVAEPPTLEEFTKPENRPGWVVID